MLRLWLMQAAIQLAQHFKQVRDDSSVWSKLHARTWWQHLLIHGTDIQGNILTNKSSNPCTVSQLVGNSNTPTWLNQRPKRNSQSQRMWQ